MINCSGCCFAVLENDTQSGCEADKLKYLSFERFEEPAKTLGLFDLERPCLYKRDNKWKTESTIEEKLKIARDQLFPNLGICIDDDSDKAEDLESLLKKIYNSDYPKNRIFIVIYARFDKGAARIPKLLNNLKSNLLTNCCAVFKIEDNVYENETSIFKKMSNATFLSRISSKSNIDFNKVFNEINKSHNDELSKTLIFKNEDLHFINKTLVSNAYLEFKDYKKMEESLIKKVQDTEYLKSIK